MNGALEYEQGNSLLQQLIRGDAMIGLVADVPKMEQNILDLLWSAAKAGHAPAFRALAQAYLSALQPIGALEGIVDDQLRDRPWSKEAQSIDDDDDQLCGGMRALFEAARLGDPEALILFARTTRHSSEENQRLAAKVLAERPSPTGEMLYVLGNVRLWLGEKESSAEAIEKAAELGDLDAWFELSLYYGQGLGVAVDEEKAKAWLQKAADGGHPRALYNVGASHAARLDFDETAKYYERAAKGGHAKAAAALGVMILTRELAGEQEKAIEWLDLADELGFPTWEMLETVGVADPRE